MPYIRPAATAERDTPSWLRSYPDGIGASLCQLEWVSWRDRFGAGRAG